jgi:hypothetical protein
MSLLFALKSITQTPAYQARDTAGKLIKPPNNAKVNQGKKGLRREKTNGLRI